MSKRDELDYLDGYELAEAYVQLGPMTYEQTLDMRLPNDYPIAKQNGFMDAVAKYREGITK